MKKVVFAFVASVVMFACGSEGGEEGKSDNQQPDTSTPAAGGVGGVGGIANERGLELIGASDCTTCHAIDKKLIGPAYVDVAKKYEVTDAVVDTLVSKIIHGGSGNWGAIPMTPHPDLPEADAKEMVNYILSLKNQ